MNGLVNEYTNKYDCAIHQVPGLQYWLIDWLIDWLTDWLTDSFIHFTLFHDHIVIMKQEWRFYFLHGPYINNRKLNTPPPSIHRALIGKYEAKLLRGGSLLEAIVHPRMALRGLVGSALGHRSSLPYEFESRRGHNVRCFIFDFASLLSEVDRPI